ncbi:cytochrome P450 27C1-like [Gigantopelta aegis]|uniref:cytochrome P450 27C1-like n=1 Tax=Gigantopelta aegis TaxID=1735272 RepID=UPI001B889B74|nr:cytochrome P450 27C1-like [Gigantopelta aegis]XP_041352069.1 cytochrome P450 27C1-like [Gigantopelta aegis]XP_041352070.1 cytochrome P450 27C1-like [Gigantopelta aegis]
MRRYALSVSKRYSLKALTHWKIQRAQRRSATTIPKEVSLQEQSTPGNTHERHGDKTRVYESHDPSQATASPTPSSGLHDVKWTSAGNPTLADGTASSATTVRRSVVRNFDSSTAKPFDSLPGPKGIYYLPIIGPLLHFKPFTNHTLKTIHELYGDFLKRYGPIVRVNFGKWMVLIEDPDDIGVVFQNEGRYPKRSTADLHLVYCKRNNIASGVAAREDEDWLLLRRAINVRMMKADAAVKYLAIQNQVADDLVSRFTRLEFSPLQLRDEFFKYATESISALAFNKRLGFLDDDLDSMSKKTLSLENMRKLFELFNESFYMGYGLYKHFRTPFYKQYEKVTNNVFGLTNSILNECLAEIKQSGKVNANNSFLETMLTQEGISLEDIRTVIIDLFVAGTDSTAKNIQMVLYTLAKNPAHQQRLYEEIKSQIGTSGPLTEDALSRMQYLKACVKEAFRVYYPTSTGTSRFLANDIVLRGYKIPKNTLMILCNHKTVKDEKYFHHPEEFIPERWLRDEHGHRMAPVHPMAMLPFGFGSRSCLGRRFAEQEIYLAIIKLLQSFEVSLEPGHEEVRLEYTVFISTREPIHFVFKKRQQ